MRAGATTGCAAGFTPGVRHAWTAMTAKPQKFVVFAIYVLVIMSMWTPASGSAAAELARYAVFVAASMAIVAHTWFRGGLRVSLSPDWLLLIAFLLYTSLSVLWGDGSPDSFIKSMLIFSALLVAISIANAQGLDQLLRVFYNVTCGFVLLSFLAVIFFPEWAIETGWEQEGNWRGIANQKNGLGAVACLVLVAALALPIRRQPTRFRSIAALSFRVMVIAISIGCLVFSSSRGAVLLAGVGIGSLLIARAPKALQRITLVLLVLFTIPLFNLAVATVELNADNISVLGTTIDTNSRTTLWLYGLEQLSGRELLGFGVAGFWTPARVTAFKDVHGWVLDNFHNGYITILIEGGLVGLLLLLMSIGFIVVLFVLAIGNRKDTHLGLAFGYTNMFLVGNLVENEIGRSTSLTFIMFLTISLALRPYLLRTADALGSRAFPPVRSGGNAPVPAGFASMR